MSNWTWLENGLFLLAWPLLLIGSLFAMALILHVLGWIFENLTWGKFERFALDGPDNKVLFVLFWPQTLAAFLYLILAPIRSKFHD